jgi:hypothetical protein
MARSERGPEERSAAAARYLAARHPARLNQSAALGTLQSDRVRMGATEGLGPEGWVHAALVNQAKQGDREAFDALARLTGDRCMAIAFRILRDFDHADDAVQAALLTAWRDIRALRDPELFEPWLHRILTNAHPGRPCFVSDRFEQFDSPDPLSL